MAEGQPASGLRLSHPPGPGSGSRRAESCFTGGRRQQRDLLWGEGRGLETSRQGGGGAEGTLGRLDPGLPPPPTLHISCLLCGPTVCGQDPVPPPALPLHTHKHALPLRLPPTPLPTPKPPIPGQLWAGGLRRWPGISAARQTWSKSTLRSQAE